MKTFPMQVQRQSMITFHIYLDVGILTQLCQVPRYIQRLAPTENLGNIHPFTFTGNGNLCKWIVSICWELKK